MLGTFFLPFGYDFLFKYLMDYTGSYELADSIFYGISTIFFIIHFSITKTNPVEELNKRAFEAKLKIMDYRSKF